MFKYDSEEKILEFVRSFESAEISRDEWGHVEHVVVAAHYCSSFDHEEALARMKTGILNLLEQGFGIGPSEESPYHETLTVFWMGAVRHCLELGSGEPIPAAFRRVAENLPKNLPFRYYSRARLFSKEARNGFVAPENPLPWSAAGGHS